MCAVVAAIRTQCHTRRVLTEPPLDDDPRCAWCGGTFRAAPRETCSVDCARKLARGEEPLPWGWPGPPETATARRRGREARCRGCARRILVTKRRRWCSARCRDLWAVEHPRHTYVRKHPLYARPCGTCGRTFTTPHHRQATCSDDCAAAYAERRRQEVLAARRRAPEQRACAWCGASFTTTSPTKRYCEHDCTLAADRIAARERARRSHARARAEMLRAVTIPAPIEHDREVAANQERVLDSEPARELVLA